MLYRHKFLILFTKFVLAEPRSAGSGIALILSRFSSILNHSRRNISLDDFDGKTPVHHLVENIGLNARNVMKAMIGRTKRIGKQFFVLLCL